MKILKIEGKKATVFSGEREHMVDISLLKDAREGDYILAHGDMAINKLDKEEVEKILQTINNFNLHE